MKGFDRAEPPLTEPDQLALGLPVGRPARGLDAIVARDDGSLDDPYTERHWDEWVAAGATRSWCRRT